MTAVKTDPSVTLLGLPFDGNSSFLRGPAEAPGKIRQALFDGASNLTCEGGLNLEGHPRWAPGEDLALSSDAATEVAFPLITARVRSLLERGERVLSLGGDHSVALPILRAYAERYSQLTVVQLDAHPDLYEELDGNRYSHACPFARACEEGLVGRLVQVGIRTANDHQKAQAERFGVETLSAWDFPRPLELQEPYYLSLDLDVLDPAVAPGVSHHEPGGLHSRELIEWIKGLPGAPVGADVVELNPQRDTSMMTARVAAKFVKELSAKMLQAAAV